MKETIRQHIITNRKEYIIILLFFIIGIFLGVLFINNTRRSAKSRDKYIYEQFCRKAKIDRKLR